MDITERERARAELERRTEDLEDFANVVSHDLRSPLNVASGYLDLVADEHDSPHIDTVRSAHERMRELIENVLTLARQGKSVDETYPVSIADVATDSWSTVETADATLDVETTRTIDADEARLRQLFGNLVRNAVEHGGSDVTVTVGDLADGSGFYVADDGPGIDPAERERVFDRGHTSTESGTGLGLSIVQEIVDAHGWEIVITESAAGGARFEIAGVERPDR
nr:HAMP domain-containing sensor histidine kinase [Halarchaeum solikamskense]